MGFQPEGDLPEGIVIPPPVEGNCTDCSYEYDYEEEQTSQQVVNRARTSTGDQTRDSVRRLNQSRGEQVKQPVTIPPLPRSQQQQQSVSFEPTPLPQSKPQPPAQASLRSKGAGLSRSRKTAPQSQRPASSSSGFANFPAREGSGGRPSNVPSRSRVVGPPVSVRSRAPPQDKSIQLQRQFQNFAPRRQNIKPTFSSRPAVPSRPALTFQDPTSPPPPSSPLSSNIPKSALEVVDFNQLLQEFQGRSLSAGNSQFTPQPAVPPVFQANKARASLRF